MTSHSNVRKKPKFGILILILVAIVCLVAVWIGLKVFFSNNGSNDNLESVFNTFVGKFTDREVTDGESAILAVQDIADDIGYTNAADELTVLLETTVGDLSYYRLQQNYHGIPVYGNSFVVVANADGETQGLSVNAVDVDESISLTPSVDDGIVQANVNTYFDSFALCPELSDEYLTIYQDKAEKSSVLAYSFEVAVNNEPFSVIVDATSGEVIKCNSLVYTSSGIPSVKEMLDKRVDVYNADGKQFCIYICVIDDEEYLFDHEDEVLYNWDGEKEYYVVGDDIFDLNDQLVDRSRWDRYEKLYLLEETDNNTVIYHRLDKMDENKGVQSNSRANLLVSELAKCHAFFSNILGRSGYDGKDGEIVAAFDDVLYDNNAYSTSWSGGTLLCIGKNQEITTDLVAHEYMHSVERSISGMLYSGESGAIMEGYSDIFGELVEDWMKNGDLDGDCDWIFDGIRNIKDPSSVTHIDCRDILAGKPCRNNGNCDETCLIRASYPEKITDRTYLKNGEVHHNSTVISHLGYMMTQSSTGGTALTTEKLAALWYNTLFTLPIDCTFSALRQNMLMVAESMGYSKEEIKCITAAFNNAMIAGRYAYETYSTNSTLELYGYDFDNNVDNNVLYDDYTIDIIKSGDEKSENKHIVVKDSNPVEIKLSAGKYSITVRDGSNTQNKYSKNISISEDSVNNVIVFATDFGKDRTHTHSYTTTSKAATCTATGWTKQVCECGDVITTTTEKVSHKYVSGKCTVCGAKETDSGSQVCGNPTITNADGLIIAQGNGLTLMWTAPSVPSSGVKYFIEIMKAGDESATCVEVTPSWITGKSYYIDAKYLSKVGTYVITLYAKAKGYDQTEVSIKVNVK